MPGVITHTLFPLLPLLAFTRIPRRAVLLALPATWLVDLDYWIEPHRALTHNVWIPLAFFGLAWASTRAPRLAKLAPWRDVLLATGIFWGGHVVMDVFAGGVVPFWPLVDTNVLVDLTVDIDTSQDRPLVYLDWGTTPGPPTVSRVYAFLTRYEAAAIAATAVVVGGVGVRRWLASRRDGDARP